MLLIWSCASDELLPFALRSRTYFFVPGKAVMSEPTSPMARYCLRTSGRGSRPDAYPEPSLSPTWINVCTAVQRRAGGFLAVLLMLLALMASLIASFMVSF